ncbi:MAG: hypothetical protein ABF624_01580 [Liquorilactobacillus ghanensis]|uniref:hypothetical protein n=1 Tax=Liquorilactobacillus ghanensis TaxID=399370 RepID=UPI0039E90E90
MNKKKINTDKRLPFDRRMKNLEVTVIVTTQKKFSGGINTKASRLKFRKKEFIDEVWWKELSDKGELVINMTILEG